MTDWTMRAMMIWVGMVPGVWLAGMGKLATGPRDWIWASIGIPIGAALMLAVFRGCPTR